MKELTFALGVTEFNAVLNALAMAGSLAQNTLQSVQAQAQAQLQPPEPLPDNVVALLPGTPV